MRLFLALDAQDLQLDLKKLRVNLSRAKNVEHKWIPQEHLHIPLAPLGEMGRESLSHFNPLIAAIVKRHEQFAVKLEGVWAYPNQNEGRLLWIGVQNAKALRSLQEDFNKFLTPIISPEFIDKTFRPHLPIVRLRNHRNVSDIISPFKNSDFGKLLVNKVLLYEMTSGGAFPTYRLVNMFPLGQVQEQQLSETHAF